MREARGKPALAVEARPLRHARMINRSYGLIVAPIAGVGLLRAVIVSGPLAGAEAVCEGAAIGAIFWLLRRLYFAFRKIQGLGLGDVKFLAAAGIWVGVAGLPMLLLVAALTALACVAVMQLTGRQLTAQTSMSFGPFLAIGLLISSGLQQYWPCC
jgi:leader peptidase (prepilin peptidase)/N-methyltransferase